MKQNFTVWHPELYGPCLFRTEAESEQEIIDNIRPNFKSVEYTDNLCIVDGEIIIEKAK